jgi:ParB-like chromosome segregation protein Spo0J
MSNFYQYKEMPIDSLIPYARNSRTHTPEQVSQIAASIKEFNFTNPVLIDSDGGIVAGHGRVLAAQKLKMQSVPCIVLDGLTEAQRKAYVIADNKLALNAGWDNELLKIELAELIDLGFDIKLTGFDGDELTNVMFGEELEQMEAEEQSVDAAFEVSVECENESEQERIYNELTAKGYKCRILTM